MPKLDRQNEQMDMFPDEKEIIELRQTVQELREEINRLRWEVQVLGARTRFPATYPSYPTFPSPYSPVCPSPVYGPYIGDNPNFPTFTCKSTIRPGSLNSFEPGWG